MNQESKISAEKLTLLQILKSLNLPQGAALLTFCGTLIGAGYVLSNNALQGELNKVSLVLSEVLST